MLPVLIGSTGALRHERSFELRLAWPYIGDVDLDRHGLGEQRNRNYQAVFPWFLDKDAGGALKRAVEVMERLAASQARPSLRQIAAQLTHSIRETQ